MDMTGIVIEKVVVFEEQWAKARNTLVQMALDRDRNAPFDYVFWADDDVIFPTDMLQKLIAHDKDIVSGLYFARKMPHWPQIYEYAKEAPGKFWFKIYYPPAELIEVDAVGAGCLLVKMDVFRKMEKPWFLFTDELGEDMYFCHKAKQMGYSVFCDTSIKCGHITRAIVDEAVFQRVQPGLFRVPTPGRMRIVFAPIPAGKPWNDTTLEKEALGGSETCVAYLARELAKRDHRVVVVSHGEEGIFNDVHYVHVNNLGNVLGQPIDVLVISRWKEALDFHAPLTKAKVFWSHDWVPAYDVVPVLDKADAVVALSQVHGQLFAIVNNMIQREDRECPPIFVMPDGIDLSLFTPDDLPERHLNRLLWTSNPARGLAVAGEWFQRFRAQRPELEFHVYGRAAVYGWGPEMEYAYMPRDRTNVFIHDPLPKAELARELMSAGLFFQPTHWPETFGIAYMEAQAAGTPIIATPTSSLPEIVRGGILTFDFEEAFERMMDPMTWLRYSGRGREFALNFGWDTIAEQWEGMLHHILQEKGHSV